jgi:hypothetical protein
MIVAESDLTITAQATSQNVINRFAAAARALIDSTDPDDLDEDTLIAGLHDLSDAALERFAMEAVRETVRNGRGDEFNDLDEAGEIPEDAVWRRSSVLEESSCTACINADGEEIESADADLTEIHEGPPETCMCIPFLDTSDL